MVGLTCGACKQPILDSNGNPRTSSAHSCRTCSASLHSVVMCDNVWQPLEDGGGNYMGQERVGWDKWDIPWDKWDIPLCMFMVNELSFRQNHIPGKHKH